ncbi:MAG: UDP-N-acetylglucosamine 1-carboxyvinyltransferase, partial [Eubacteriales bacterium]
MSFYRIDGGHRLTGELMVHGAKNSVLPILASTLLASGESVIHNCPKLSDVEATLAILRELGCRVTRQESTVTVDATTLTTSEISCELMQEMRSSVLFLGALISRIGEATVCAPGGCKLGPRPIDLHLSALSQMGVTIDERGESLACTRGTRTHSTTISLPFPSVGATENILLAACGCKGETILIGAAQEPEIVDLQNCLCSMGATISGAGTNKITIQGGRALSPTEYHVMGDRIVATTYLAAAAITGGTVAMR